MLPILEFLLFYEEFISQTNKKYSFLFEKTKLFDIFDVCLLPKFRDFKNIVTFAK